MSTLRFQTVIVIGPKTLKEYEMIESDANIYLSDHIPDDIECIVDQDNGKTLLIIDDYDMTKLYTVQTQNLSMLFKYVSRHYA
jgi:hypothetical protein